MFSRTLKEIQFFKFYLGKYYHLQHFWTKVGEALIEVM